MMVEHGVVYELDLRLDAPSDVRLRGLRVGVKDLFDIAGYPTAAGNPDWLATHPIPEQTASAVTNLLDAGAVVVAKTLTDELAYSLNGVNAHYGTPTNAAAPERLPGGSSSGSAAMVAHGLAEVGLGTDTGGSIRVPSSYNGLYGLRPTHGVIPVDHLVPLAPSFDTIGWMTRDLDTLRRVGEVLLSPAPEISYRRLGVLRPAFGADHPWSSHIDPWMKAGVGEQVETLELFDIPLSAALMQRASQTFRILQGAEIWTTHGQWIEAARPTFAPDIAERFEWCRQISATDVAQAKQDREEIRQIVAEWFAGGDTALLLPTTPGAAPLLDESADRLAQYRIELMGLTALAGLTERPQLHLPVWHDQGAPWGVSLLGDRHSDRSLMALGERLAGS